MAAVTSRETLYVLLATFVKKYLCHSELDKVKNSKPVLSEISNIKR